MKLLFVSDMKRGQPFGGLYNLWKEQKDRCLQSQVERHPAGVINPK